MDSQRQQLLEFMEKGGRLTSLVAVNRFGCLRLASRINEIKKGANVASRFIEVKNRFGVVVKVKEYWIEEEEQQCPKNQTELIHLRHDAKFKAEAARVGASLRARSHPELRKTPKYLYLCPGCRKEYPRQKRFRLASCGDCSQGGKFDSRYKLKLKRKKPKELIDC